MSEGGIAILPYTSRERDLAVKCSERAEMMRARKRRVWSPPPVLGIGSDVLCLPDARSPSVKPGFICDARE